MFKKNRNKNVYQPSLNFMFSDEFDEFIDSIKNTEEYYFNKMIYSNINEEIFQCLYDNTNGRPNAPINSMLAALIFREKKKWSYNELLNQLKFNFATRYAVGIYRLEKVPFNEATLFNFQNRVKNYQEENGKDLIEEVFNQLTIKQIKKLRIKTGVCRTDSIMINSNIKKYGRLELLIEIVLRLYKKFTKSFKKEFNKKFVDYTRQSSQKFIYNLRSSDLSHEYEEVAKMYYWLYYNLDKSYKTIKEYENFERIFFEHFEIEDNKISLKPSEKLNSDILQSPDDSDATFRTKRGKNFRGFTGNVVETADPDNKVNLIMDATIEKNNMDDSKILENRIDKIDDKYDLEELYFDGGYGSEEVDEKLVANDIKPIQTAVKGRKAKVKMKIEKSDEKYEVTCQRGYKSIIIQTKTRYKAEFDAKKCSDCPLVSKCPTKKQKKKSVRVFYFAKADYVRFIRITAIDKLEPDRRYIRNNVEATMNEFSHKLNAHKLKVRGIFKASLFIYFASISINFGRIYRSFQDSSFYFIFSKICGLFSHICEFFTNFNNFFLKNKNSRNTTLLMYKI